MSGCEVSGIEKEIDLKLMDCGRVKLLKIIPEYRNTLRQFESISIYNTWDLLESIDFLKCLIQMFSLSQIDFDEFGRYFCDLKEDP